MVVKLPDLAVFAIYTVVIPVGVLLIGSALNSWSERRARQRRIRR